MRRRFMLMMAAAVACLGVAVALSIAGQPARGPAATAPANMPMTVSPETDAARAVGRQMQAQAALLAGYPQVGMQVEVWVKQGATFTVPASFEKPGATQSGNNTFLLHGKLTAFDANWVGLEGSDGAKMWLPRENIAHVYEPPAGKQITGQPPGAH
ncbi:MAG: hypothetical protein QOF78_2166 [Phycisphaerales bacterium]|jgi:hypothetical protein|nr:hypothetical protein [Phycisphaerales bacterium]